MNFWIVLQILIIVFLGLFLLIGTSNLWAFRRPSGFPLPAHFPRVSILVPARNEEANITDCIRSLLSQDYPEYEVVVLDDNSTDRTLELVQQLAASDSRLRVIAGQPLPAGWIGKSWACHQLAQQATGEILLFTDVDTRHAPNTLRDTVAALLAQKAALLSLIPYEEAVTWSERVTVPFFSSFSIFGLLPLFLAYRIHSPFFSAANGQFMMFRREAYQQIGGHYAVRNHAIEDLALVREVATHKLRWRLMNGGWHVRCRMYRDYRSVLEGFSKNLFAGFDYRLLLFVISWLWLEVIFWEPLVVISLGAAGVAMSVAQVELAAIAILMSLILWVMLYVRFRHPMYLAFLYPVTLVFIVLIAWRSLALTLAGRTTWKGRQLVRGRLRLI